MDQRHQELAREAITGNTQRVIEILRKYFSRRSNCAKVNNADNFGWNALAHACSHHNYGVVKVLLAHPQIDPNQCVFNQTSPLFLACQNGSVDIVGLLLSDDRVDVNLAVENKFSPLFVACQNGHAQVLELLLICPKVDMARWSSQDDASPLYMACFKGHTKVVHLLLNDGRFDPNQKYKGKATPLYAASFKGHLEIVKLLFQDERVIDINNTGTSPMASSSASSSSIASISPTQCRVTRRRGATTSVVPSSSSSAASSSHSQATSATATTTAPAAGALPSSSSSSTTTAPSNNNLNPNNVNHQPAHNPNPNVNPNLPAHGSTNPLPAASNSEGPPLYVACQEGHLEVVKLFLQHPNINPNKPTEKGSTPFYAACSKGHLEVVKLLLADGRIDVQKPMQGGYTPFYVACQNGHVDVVNLLLQFPNRINVNQPIDGGFSPLYIACQNNHIKVVRLLLDNERVNVDQANERSSTPLYIASSKGHTEVVRLMLYDHCRTGEININQKNYINTTALWMAAQNGHIDVVSLILSSKGNVDISIRTIAGPQKWNGKTALEQARERNHLDLVSLLEAYQNDPDKTRQQLRIQIGVAAVFATDIFAMGVMLCDKYFELPEEQSEVFSQASVQENSSEECPEENEQQAPPAPPQPLITSTQLYTPVSPSLQSSYPTKRRRTSLGKRKDLKEKGKVAYGEMEIDPDLENHEDTSFFISDSGFSFNNFTASSFNGIGINYNTQLNFTDLNSSFNNNRGFNSSNNSNSSFAGFIQEPMCLYPTDPLCVSEISPSSEVFRSMGNSTLSYKDNEALRRQKIVRFFRILMAVPLEIQMVLCNRLYGLKRDLIPAQQSEAAFRKIARYFLLYSNKVR